jgi:hypothetical protein
MSFIFAKLSKRPVYWDLVIMTVCPGGLGVRGPPTQEEREEVRIHLFGVIEAPDGALKPLHVPSLILREVACCDAVDPLLEKRC